MFGRSKQTFLKTRVVPANDNDAFNDNKCTYCWDPYDEEHPGVRVLPCNHVFGRECLIKIINAPNGDVCPICRTTLFNPSMHVAFERLFQSGIDRLALCLMMLAHKLLVVQHSIAVRIPATLKGVLRVLWRFYWLQNNPYYYADLLVNHCTNLRERNPELNVKSAECVYAHMLLALRMISKFCGIQLTPTYHLLVAIVLVPLFSYKRMHGKLTNPRDRFIFALIVLVSVFIPLGASFMTLKFAQTWRNLADSVKRS
jgi:hypothetical protein